MKNFFKQHGCKLILSLLNASMFGGTYIYVDQFKALTRQIQASERVVVTEVNKLQRIGTNIEQAATDAESEFKKAEKACKRLF